MTHRDSDKNVEYAEFITRLFIQSDLLLTDFCTVIGQKYSIIVPKVQSIGYYNPSLFAQYKLIQDSRKVKKTVRVTAYKAYKAIEEPTLADKVDALHIFITNHMLLETALDKLHISDEELTEILEYLEITDIVMYAKLENIIFKQKMQKKLLKHEVTEKIKQLYGGKTE